MDFSLFMKNHHYIANKKEKIIFKLLGFDFQNFKKKKRK